MKTKAIITFIMLTFTISACGDQVSKAPAPVMTPADSKTESTDQPEDQTTEDEEPPQNEEMDPEVVENEEETTEEEMTETENEEEMQTETEPKRQYGEPCDTPDQCIDGACVGSGDVPLSCSRSCDSNAANDCREHNTFCADFTNGSFCFGPTIDTGLDVADDEVLEIGDCVTRNINTLGDKDMFLVRSSRSSRVIIYAEPLSPHLDIDMDFYNNTFLVGRSNSFGPGQNEGLIFEDFKAGEKVTVVVSDGGSAITNEYRLCAEVKE